MAEETVGPRARWDDEAQDYVEKPRKKHRCKRREPVVVARVADMVAMNISQRQIAKRVKIDRKTISKMMTEAGMTEYIAERRARLLAFMHSELDGKMIDSMKRHADREEGDGFLANKYFEATQVFDAKAGKDVDGPRITINITRDRRPQPVRMGSIEAEVVKQEPTCPDSNSGNTPSNKES
jgi:hypothetical protein